MSVTAVLLAALCTVASAPIAGARVATTGFSLGDGRLHGSITCVTGRGWGLLTCNRVSDGLWVRFEDVSQGPGILVTHGHEVIRERLPAVRANEVWSAAGVTCRVGARGIICLESHGHGWWLGRIGGQRFFGPTRGP